MAKIRHRVEPRDVPADKAARRLHLTLDEFTAKLPALLARGFPPPDPTTGHFHLPDIDRWMGDRNKGLSQASPPDAGDMIKERIARLRS